MPGSKQIFTGGGPDRRSLAWFLAFRVVIITLFLGGTSVFFLTGKMGGDIAPYLFLLLALSYLQALVSALALLWVKRHSFFAQVQLFWDLLFVTTLILITGGVESAFPFVYLLVIVSGSFLLPRRQTIYVAGTAAILFGGLLDLQYFGYIRVPNGNTPSTYELYIYSVFVHVLAFLLTGLLSGTLAERWRYSEAALQRKSIDYAELERLNRTILSHISSGLMIINRQGRIRSFNAAASDITGYSLEDIYDQEISAVFPSLKVLDRDGYIQASRAEALIESKAKKRLVLGYATMPIRDHREVEVGLLITFQDLTKLKEVEIQLQRADRLAAVGRLASGMAHEIRNPLASISGSVQLLLEDESLDPQNQKLMQIVFREAGRLSKLLNDFLVFARPRPPQKEVIDVCALFEELRELIGSDPRLANLTLQLDCPASATLDADRNMLHQTIWNLLLNANDAVSGKGTVVLGFDDSLKLLWVEDSGPGIDPGIIDTLFDPFVSTREQGTGLGLATVYTIMEAHGARINLGRSRYGGAAFYFSFVEQG